MQKRGIREEEKHHPWNFSIEVLLGKKITTDFFKKNKTLRFIKEKCILCYI